jgi:hypothetical protein
VFIHRDTDSARFFVDPENNKVAEIKLYNRRQEYKGALSWSPSKAWLQPVRPSFIFCHFPLRFYVPFLLFYASKLLSIYFSWYWILRYECFRLNFNPTLYIIFYTLIWRRFVILLAQQSQKWAFQPSPTLEIANIKSKTYF